ncbi:MAG: SGNH/GDSL hydrolase family protein [Woeseiaceae bacterium]|nr:SGNH/GDSL hydrolase family protein [Woeseiaceae bacterium]
MRSLLFWVLLPLLLPQALYVRKNAPRFAPADGPSNGTLGYGKQARLLAIGDSIIAGVGATTLSNALVGQTATALATLLDGGVNWQALGVSGYSSEKVLNRLLPKLPETKFDYVILSVGVNDVTGLTTLRQWRRNLNFLLSRLQAHSPDAVIAVAGLPPLHGFPLLPQPLRAVFGMRGRTFDEELRKILEGLPNCVYAPLDFDPDPSQFAPDGYHPSEESYAVYGQHLADKLIKANI